LRRHGIAERSAVWAYFTLVPGALDSRSTGVGYHAYHDDDLIVEVE
jgi:hypothetical protein